MFWGLVRSDLPWLGLKSQLSNRTADPCSQHVLSGREGTRLQAYLRIQSHTKKRVSDPHEAKLAAACQSCPPLLLR